MQQPQQALVLRITAKRLLHCLMAHAIAEPGNTR